MPKIYLSISQKAKQKEKELYELIESRKIHTKFKWSDMAAELGETKQTFKYRFDNKLLEGWELITIFYLLGIEAEELKEFVS